MTGRVWPAAAELASVPEAPLEPEEPLEPELLLALGAGFELVVDARTTTVPCMFGWIVQM